MHAQQCTPREHVVKQATYLGTPPPFSSMGEYASVSQKAQTGTLLNCCESRDQYIGAGLL